METGRRLCLLRHRIGPLATAGGEEGGGDEPCGVAGVGHRLERYRRLFGTHRIVARADGKGWKPCDAPYPLILVLRGWSIA